MNETPVAVRGSPCEQSTGIRESETDARKEVEDTRIAIGNCCGFTYEEHPSLRAFILVDEKSASNVYKDPRTEATHC